MMDQTIQQIEKVDSSDFQQKEFSDDNLYQLVIGFIVLMCLFLFPMFSAQGLFY